MDSDTPYSSDRLFNGILSNNLLCKISITCFSVSFVHGCFLFVKSPFLKPVTLDYLLPDKPSHIVWGDTASIMNASRAIVSLSGEEDYNFQLFGHPHNKELRALDELPHKIEIRIKNLTKVRDNISIKRRKTGEYQSIDSEKRAFEEFNSSIQTMLVYNTDIRFEQDSGAYVGTISCDMNYRSKLWQYGKKASEIMPELINYCDVAIGNEEDADKVLGIKAPDTDVTSGEIDATKYKFVVQEIMKTFPNLKYVAITLRGSISASHNTWSGVLYDGKEMFIGPQYNITHIVDRVGGGDSFMAGLIYGLLKNKNDPQYALRFALAASCLKHTIFGDVNLVNLEEVTKLMEGDTSGRVSR